MKNKKMKFVAPEITLNSSFRDLTMSLLYSYQETEQKMVEDMLTAREDALKEQIQVLDKMLKEEKNKVEYLVQCRLEFEEKMKEKWVVLEKEGELKRKVLEKEVESLREKCEELKKGGDLKREMKDERRLQREMFENQNDELQKGFKEELEKMRECYKEEMERKLGIMEKKLASCEFEKLKVEMELEKSRMQNEVARKGLKGELQKGRRNYEEELLRERDLCEASNVESFPTESGASHVNESFKTPQVEGRGSRGITIGVQMEVATSRSDNEIRWEHKVDMLSAFKNDPELCLAAVCTLYRQTISSNLSRNSFGFRSSDIVRGAAIAKYLINNDPENKLSRSLLEVQQNRKNLLGSCQKLANQYAEQLFTIYHQEFDPFFSPKS